MKDKLVKKKRDADIDAHLRMAFQELSAEPLPDKFADLLARLRETDQEPDPARTGASQAEGADKN